MSDAAFTTDRVSFTHMAPEAINAIRGRIRREAERNDGYTIRFNANDAALLVDALATAAEESGDPDFREEIERFLSDIGETVNVEMI